jgi:hypothetical protein
MTPLHKWELGDASMGAYNFGRVSQSSFDPGRTRFTFGTPFWFLRCSGVTEKATTSNFHIIDHRIIVVELDDLLNSVVDN